MQIGGLKLKNPFVAAPMAGISGPAFRLLAKGGGASLVCTEMVSARALADQGARGIRAARIYPEERPVALQLFGAEPAVMRRAARLAAELEPDLIDLNLGCPARKVRHQGAGSALLEDPPRAAALVAAAVEGAGGLPVTVKLRLGLAKDDLATILPPILAAGAAAVTLHARTVRQGFAGAADWAAIRRLAAWCPVPVIGNGDVKSGRDAARMLAETGCAGVMIGRASLGDPWIFGRAEDRLAGREPRPLSLAEREEALYRHADLARRLGGEGQAVHFIKKFMMWYTRGLPGAVSFRQTAGPLKELAPLWRLCRDYFAELATREAA